MGIILLIHVFMSVICTKVYGQSYQSINIIDHIKSNAIVRQSSIFPKGSPAEHGYYNASKAIDGQINCTDIEDECCSVTDENNLNQTSWWQIDLSERFSVHTVEIYGRFFSGPDSDDNKQLENAKIITGNTSSELQVIYIIPTINNTTHFIHKHDASITAQYFGVQLSYNILTICDFILHGNAKLCNVGEFGQSCHKQCHCADGEKCDILTGKCQSADCLPGWIGRACDINCSYRKFGKDCKEECKNCLGNSSCNNANGSCLMEVCDAGWQGFSCNQKCQFARFGMNCSSHCHCYNDSECNHINGKCAINLCDLGWQGKTCSDKCDTKTFGQNCSKRCNCLEKTSCNHVSGTCKKGICDPGWKGLACNMTCPRRTFGQNCANTCHCSNNTDCDKRNGTCLSGLCEKDYQGNDCSRHNQYIPSKSRQNSSGPIIGGTVIGAVLLVIGVIAVFIKYKRWKSSQLENTVGKIQFSQLDTANETRNTSSNMQQRSKARTNENRGIEEKRNDSQKEAQGQNDYYSFGDKYKKIQIHELWDYIHEKMENQCEGFYKEFQLLPKGLINSCTAAKSVSNRGKNRYKEMFAYDDTRVILEDINDSKGITQTNYINACYIEGFEKKKKFVASQGPTKEMIDDFWRMIWQLKSDKIVMLTDLVEHGTVKCLQYWPNEDEDECLYGNIVVNVLETDTYLDYNIRYLEARKNGENSRRIRQFHFKSWPDKDVPDSTWCLVNFWRIVDTNAISTAEPIVVHCSAGVGRTGTFIALDNIANQAILL